MNRPGKFIVIEGLDGSGSTTQATKLAGWLRRGGYKVVLTREPSQGPGGSMIRLSLSGRLELDEKTRALLFAADRMDHVYSNTGILSSLSDPETVVISERYLVSFLAYQSYDANADIDWLLRISSNLLPPDLTIWLDVPAEESVHRIQVNRGFHQELYETTEQLAAISERAKTAIEKLRSNGFDVRTISGLGNQRQVASRVRLAVETILSSGYTRRAEWPRLFDQYPLVAQLVNYLELNSGVSCELREIQHGIQVIALNGSDVVRVNIYETGSIQPPQGHSGLVKGKVEEAIKALHQGLPLFADGQ